WSRCYVAGWHPTRRIATLKPVTSRVLWPLWNSREEGRAVGGSGANPEDQAVANVECIWDLEADPEGNVQHIAEHGITVEEAEEAVQACYGAAVASRSSERPTVFGLTSTDKHLAVVFEVVDESLPQVYVVTAYEV